MARSRTNRGFVNYNTYSFSEKSPMIDLFIALRSEADLSYEQISEKSGVSTNTQRAWEYGKTMRPLEATIFAAMNAIPGFRGIGFRAGKPFILKK